MSGRRAHHSTQYTWVLHKLEPPLEPQVRRSEAPSPELRPVGRAHDGQSRPTCQGSPALGLLEGVSSLAGFLGDWTSWATAQYKGSRQASAGLLN